jgi:SAM-dependent methyltransferase
MSPHYPCGVSTINSEKRALGEKDAAFKAILRPGGLMLRVRAAVLLVAVASVLSLSAQQRASPQELKQAAVEVPQLVDVLELKPGMTFADVGAGFGATTIVLSQLLGPASQLYATDITPHALSALRAEALERKLSNVTVVEGGAASTNLPDGCCDAILMRDVYHHITNLEAFTRSLLAALKSGGRLAIIDFAPESGSTLPAGVPANRGGHGIRQELVVEELSAAGFTHVRTIPVWPPERTSGGLFLVVFRR